jgi:hypothetical protein
MKKKVAAVMSALGFTAMSIVGSVPAHAACTHWQWHGQVQIDHSDGVFVIVNQWDGVYADTNAGAQLLLSNHQPAFIDFRGTPQQDNNKGLPFDNPSDAPYPQVGSPYGGWNDTNHFDMTLVWKEGDGGLNPAWASQNRYLGSVDGNGYVSGSVENSLNHITTQWHFDKNVTCA